MIRLCPMERSIVELLYEHRYDRPVPVAEIIERLYENDPDAEPEYAKSAVVKRIFDIRKIISEYGVEIVTLWGRGYQIKRRNDWLATADPAYTATAEEAIFARLRAEKSGNFVRTDDLVMAMDKTNPTRSGSHVFKNRMKKLRVRLLPTSWNIQSANHRGAGGYRLIRKDHENDHRNTCHDLLDCKPRGLSDGDGLPVLSDRHMSDASPASGITAGGKAREILDMRRHAG